ncbi:hypothetical protein U1Q18_051317 [Sarracenia purpurea var. burkii]
MKQIRLHRESVHNLDEKWNPFVPNVIQNHDKRFNVNTGKRHVLQPKDDGKSFFCNSKTTSRKISHNDKSFVCDKCDVKFPKLIQLRDHIKNNRYCRPYWCNDCSSKFIQKKKLEKHVRIHLYKCQECSKSFPYKNYLDVHYYNEHMQSIDLDIKSQPGFLCRYCGLPFSTEEELQNHIKLSGENLIICAECLDVFETEGADLKRGADLRRGKGGSQKGVRISKGAGADLRRGKGGSQKGVRISKGAGADLKKGRGSQKGQGRISKGAGARADLKRGGGKGGSQKGRGGSQEGQGRSGSQKGCGSQKGQGRISKGVRISKGAGADLKRGRGGSQKGQGRISKGARADLKRAGADLRMGRGGSQKGRGRI